MIAMATSAESEIETRFAQLSAEAQLSLLERLVHCTRETVTGLPVAWEADLAAMAADPQVQKELISINAEFQVTEADHLENS